MDSQKVGMITLFCPNCGQKVIGYKNDDDSIRIVCKKCRSVIFSKKHKRKETMIKVVSVN